MSLERLSLLAQSDSGNGVSPVMWVALAAVVLLVVFIWKSFKPKGTTELKPDSTSDGTSGRKQTLPVMPDNGTPTLTAEDVVLQRFMPTKFREGYDQDQVDDFLDRTVQELRRLQEENERLQLRISNRLAGSVSLTDPILTPEQVVSQKFNPTKFREGYAQNEVDDFLLKIVTGLRERSLENERLRARVSGNVRS